MLPPKRFKQNTTKATEIKRNGTEAIGIDQDGVAKSIDIEVLMNKDNVGLGDVDNTSDADKPLSDADIDALALKESIENVNTLKGTGWAGETVKGNARDLSTHKSDLANPHAVTKTQVGLGNVANKTEAEMVASGAISDALALKTDKTTTAALDTRVSRLETGKYYGLRRRSDGVLSRTGLAVGMTPSRSNGTFNPAISDFRKVRPWSEIRICLTDRVGKIISVQGDNNFTARANEKNADGSHKYNFGSMFFPFYMRISEGVDVNGFAYKEWAVSETKINGFNMHPAFVREDGTIRPYVIINSYKTGLDTDGKVCSKPDVVPLTNTSVLSFDTKYAEIAVGTKWLGGHFTTTDVWRMLAIIEYGTFDIQPAVGQGISSSMPYSSSADYQLTVATTTGNSVTILDKSQPFYIGMDVQIGSSYSNQIYASNRKIVSIDKVTVPGSMVIEVDGAPFSAPIGGWIVTWGQSDTVANLLQMGTSCGWLSQWGAESRSHVYLYGLVDPYANVYEAERGKMRKAKRFFVNFNPLTSVGISDPETAGYIDCGEFSTGAATYGWISDFKIVTLGLKQMQLVSAVGGNSIGDVIYYADDTRTGTYVCFRGGLWGGGSGCGPFCGIWDYAPSGASIGYGDRGILLEPVLQAS